MKYYVLPKYIMEFIKIKMYLLNFKEHHYFSVN